MLDALVDAVRISPEHATTSALICRCLDRSTPGAASHYGDRPR
jgi:hypothetical protein